MRLSLTLAVKTVKLAMENVHSLFYFHREHTPFQAAQKQHCPHGNHATHLRRDHALFEVLYNSALHCSVHRVTVGILNIVLPFGSIITI